MGEWGSKDDLVMGSSSRLRGTAIHQSSKQSSSETIILKWQIHNLLVISISESQYIRTSRFFFVLFFPEFFSKQKSVIHFMCLLISYWKHKFSSFENQNVRLIKKNKSIQRCWFYGTGSTFYISLFLDFLNVFHPNHAEHFSTKYYPWINLNSKILLHVVSTNSENDKLLKLVSDLEWLPSNFQRFFWFYTHLDDLHFI